MSATSELLHLYLQTFSGKTRIKGAQIYTSYKNNDLYNTTGLLFDFEERAASIKTKNVGKSSITLLIPSQRGDDEYEVTLSWIKTKITGHCECPAFQDYGPCKHMVAAIYCLLEIDKNAEIEQNKALKETKKNSGSPQKEIQNNRELKEKIRLREDPHKIFETLIWRIAATRQSMVDERKITMKEPEQDAGNWEFTYRFSAKQIITMQIVYDRKDLFVLSCSCDDQKNLCKHLLTAIQMLYYNKGEHYFLKFKNFQPEKEQLLSKIGLLPSDPEAAEVVFEVDYRGILKMKVPNWLWTPDLIDVHTQSMRSRLDLKEPQTPGENGFRALASRKEFVPLVVFQTATNNLPFNFELSIVNGADGKFIKMSTANEEKMQLLKAAVPPDVYDAIERISLNSLNELLRREGYYYALPNAVKNISEDSSIANNLKKRYAAVLQTLWPWLCAGSTQVYTTDETRVTRNASKIVQLHLEPVAARIQVRPAGKFIELAIQYSGANSGIPIDGRLHAVGGVLLTQGDIWYLPADEETQGLMAQFPSGFVKLPATAQDAIMTSILPSLRSRYEVSVDAALQPKVLQLQPVCSVHLSEQGKSLLLMPRFSYSGQNFYYEQRPQPHLFRADNEWAELIRDEQTERDFVEKIKALHPIFKDAASLQIFAIPFQEALRDSWYQKMQAQLTEAGVAITGVQELQHFRYNPNTAAVSVSSAQQTGNAKSIDWFDLLIEISFGEQKVSLKDVRRALMKGEAGVRLEDGSIGLLPDDFVREYGHLLRLGTEQKDGALRVSKLHFTLIDAIHEAALSRDVQSEIAAKKEALRQIENLQTAAVPTGIQATLRPYQIAGFKWMQTLHQLGWGGCLADDMGLGKTLQVITFLQFLNNTEKGNGRHLVVCPTSLIYNWQAELDKFAPGLTYYVYYGLDRAWDKASMAEVCIVITSYGVLRSELKTLIKEDWHYVILDESQAIKNPDAMTTKAAHALKARNRICMSGTPLQNNTYDLYAQFQFLNAGMLGNKDFFRTEFANPIDKQGSNGAAATLRKMLAPFMLRRTKEQVARDLPDKTEVTLWCDMQEEQRAVYDEYRRFYRDSLLQRIDEDGMAGSAIYVLEALLRLRQLCDHPAMVKNKEITTQESVKLNELRHEILENTQGRKVLVFSQFTEMLALIRDAFDQDGIVYEYLDGSTPAKKRKEAVERFQNMPSVQVFLISLKAGGVGLNLTAAEYVYIVDPWWNPAVEAQAIDRTHRIGQKNKIVAYRMICKDTVEEKVMLLQTRKRELAAGLVTEDAGISKNLTREDVAYLLA